MILTALNNILLDVASPYDYDPAPTPGPDPSPIQDFFTQMVSSGAILIIPALIALIVCGCVILWEKNKNV